MQNNVEFWNEKLHLDEFKKLLVCIYEGRKSDLSIDNVSINDKNFSISLSNLNGDKELRIICSDGRELSIYLNSFHLDINDFYYENYSKQVSKGAKFIYKIGDKELTWNSDNLWDYASIGYKNIDKSKLINDMRIDLSKKRRLQFIDMNFFNYINLCSEVAFSNYYYIDKFGIYEVFDDRKYVVSPDCDRVISVNGKEIPNYAELKSFEPIKELELFKKIVHDNKDELHSFEDEVLDNLMIGLKEKKQFYKKICFYYEHRLPLCKEAIDNYQKALNEIENYVFSIEELSVIADLLKEAIDKNEVVSNENLESEKPKVLKK